MKCRSSLASTLVTATILLISGHCAAHAAPVVKEVGAGEHQVMFSFKPDAATKTVHLAGEFNGWSLTATPMIGPDADGRFTATLALKRGRYEYKFVCDGSRWTADPETANAPGAYGNSVLLVGVNPDETRPSSAQSVQPRDMVAQVTHPHELTAALERCCFVQMHSMPPVFPWFSEHPMPWFSERAVSFVYCNHLADPVRLILEGPNLHMGYDLSPTEGRSDAWSISLDRSQIHDRLGYVYEVKRGETWERVLDPNARSYTSRGGRPVGLVAPPSDDRGCIRVIEGFKPSSTALLPRDLYVYLPAEYDQQATSRHPVLYMHDGQNCWDDPVEPFGHGGWQVNVTADRLIREGKARPFIVVAIANTPKRMEEYGPGADVTDASNHAYIRFLIDDVKPMIDQRYRTLPDPADTAIMGSSMGGLISFQAALLRPDVFGMSGVMSPAFWFKDPKGQSYDALLAIWRSEAASSQPASAIRAGSASARSLERPKIYLDSGTAGQGQDGAPDTRKMAAALRAAGWKDGVDLMHFEDEGAQHNERAWRARVHRPLEFMFAK